MYSALIPQSTWDRWLATAEVVCLFIFLAEYLIRIVCSPFSRFLLTDQAAQKAYLRNKPKRQQRRHPRNGILRMLVWVFKWENLVDLASVTGIIFYFMHLPSFVSVLRLMRLIRIMRVFRVDRYAETAQVLVSVVRQSLAALEVLLFMFLLLVLICGSLIYFAEAGEWYPPGTTIDGYFLPDGGYLRLNILGTEREPTPYSSIPASFWWVVVTATTVGYGDHVPTSPLGKFIASVTMLTGVILMALPVGVVSGFFSQEYAIVLEKKKAHKQEMKDAGLHKVLSYTSPLSLSPDLVPQMMSEVSTKIEDEGAVEKMIEKPVEELLEAIEARKDNTAESVGNNLLAASTKHLLYCIKQQGKEIDSLDAYLGKVFTVILPLYEDANSKEWVGEVRRKVIEIGNRLVVKYCM
eukprot:Platyproteum_vivax@DN6964_c0_g1_i3.p1